MPGTFSDSWKLTKTSFRLIAEDRSLLVFPVVGGLGVLAIVFLWILGEYFLVGPAWAAGTLTDADVAVGIGVFLAAYFAMAFVSVYATAGLIAAATLKLNGGQPTARDGWRVARGRVGRLLAWALLTATVGLAIQAISHLLRGVGGAVVGLVGGASWGVVTYFMIPVLLYEDASAWKGLGRSARLFVQTFGRNLLSNLVVGLLIGAGFILAVILFILGLLVFAHPLALGLAFVGLGIAVGVGAVLIGTAAEGILRAALYRYAITGKIDPDLLPVAYVQPPVVSPPLP